MSEVPPDTRLYRGRLAPSPTGCLHLGHARTFWTAFERAKKFRGTLILRNEDLDRSRARPEFVRAFIEDLHWLGIEWQEGCDIAGPFAPYNQSERMSFYRQALQELRNRGTVYPCLCSRQDVLRSVHAPHHGDEEPIYPGTCRPKESSIATPIDNATGSRGRISWRFKVPDGEGIYFEDLSLGKQNFVAGKDFGDFVVWRHDDVPAYQLAVVVDDSAMRVSEVVRGADLLLSTARQLLLYRAMGLKAPDFFHCPLLTDEKGARLAKRHDSLSLRALRAAGFSPEEVRARWENLADRALSS